MTISQIITAITSGTKTAEEITRYYLAQIADKNPQINAFVEVFEADAIMKVISSNTNVFNQIKEKFV